MGKLNEKRRRNRQEYLRRLAMKNPAKFQREWSKRLPNYVIDAAHRLTALPAPLAQAKAFDVVTEALADLAKIGTRAIHIVFIDECTTEKVLNSSCEYIV